MPISFSIMVDKAPNREATFSQIQSRSLDFWADEEKVNACFECKGEKAQFGMGILSSRKHHCRKCGRVFCCYCASKEAPIPFYITNVPIPHEKHKHEDRSKPVRLCEVCFEQIQNLETMSHHVFTREAEKSLEICDLKQLALCTKDNLVRQWANFKLSTMREIQYRRPDHEFSQEEKEMLWVNRRHFVGHNIWLVQLLRSIDYAKASPTVLREIDVILKLCIKVSDSSSASSKMSCWDLMCSRRCQAKLSIEDCIQLLNQKVRYNPVRRLALSFMSSCPDTELKNHISYIVRHSLYASTINEWLIKKCAQSEIIANETFWELQTYFSKENHLQTKKVNSEVIHEALAAWSQAVPEAAHQKVICGQKFDQMIRTAYFESGGGPEEVARAFAISQNCQFTLPTDINQTEEFKVDYKAIQVKESGTSPVLIPMYPTVQSVPSVPEQKVLLLWKPVDIRKEQIILNTIRTMKLVLLKEEGLDLPIVDYALRPTGAIGGFVEIVPNCISLSELRKTDTGILPWLIEQNEKAQVTAGYLRERFLESCAAYCIITFLLGIGDRHLDNILLRSDGCLFHIDYGFVLGQDPKPVKTPEMRITVEMLAALGGRESEAYKRFQALCSRIYNCLRRNVNLFICMLRMFVEADPPICENGIISEERLMEEVLRRFVPGETSEEAQIFLYNHLQDSTSQPFSYKLIDGVHNLAQVSSAKFSGFLSKQNTTQVIVHTLWSVTGLGPPTKKLQNNNPETELQKKEEGSNSEKEKEEEEKDKNGKTEI